MWRGGYVTVMDVEADSRRVQFAIRPNMRNHNILKRDAVIKTVAGLVGQPHKVDLKNYDLLIIVEIYQVRTTCICLQEDMTRRFISLALTMIQQNICGVSVVDHRFEELKRYNLAEIFDPTPKEEVKNEGGEAVVTDVPENAVGHDDDGKAE